MSLSVQISEIPDLILRVVAVDAELEDPGDDFPVGFNSTGVELGRTLGRPYVADEVADPNIVRLLKLFSGPRPQNHVRPQWTMLNDQSIASQYLEHAMTLSPEDLKFGVAMSFDGFVNILFGFSLLYEFY